MSDERIDYRIERQRHEGFVGRAALLARLDQLLVADRTDRIDRWVVVTGGPGMGKSAMLAAWLARREAAGVVVPHHFIRRGEYDWDDPAKLVGSLVAQLEERFPDQREPAVEARAQPAARLTAMLMRVSTNELVPRGERLIVLLDGLDEYDPPVGTPTGDPLRAFLPHALPRGVSFLCSTRPRHPYLPMLKTRAGTHLSIDLDTSDHATDNTATVRAFWDLAAPPLGLDARFIDEAVACAAGNMQHAVTLRKHLEGLPETQRRVERLPEGLEALLVKVWERVAAEPIAVHGLGILCAAREALTLDELGTVAGWTGVAQRGAFVRGAREFLVETRRVDHQPEYRLHHDSIREHIASMIGAAELRGHHAALAQQLATWPAPVDATPRRYALRHALTHRAEAGDWSGAWRLAADMGFLETKCRDLGAHEAEADVARAAERCRASGDQTLCRRLDDLARALMRESHWLRDAPEATAALVWNRLRWLGWGADDLDEQLQLPPAATFLRVRHRATRQSHALLRDLVGHASVVTACAVTPDGRRVVSASGDRTLKVWDLGSGRLLITLEGHAGPVTACAVTPDGRRVVSASWDRTLELWDLDSGRALTTFEGHTDYVTACAVIPDGRRVVSASYDGTLKVWDLDSGHLLATFQGHAHGVTACAVTPDGRRVVSASRDRTLKLWDLDSGRVLVTFEGHAGWVTACAVIPDGRRVVSASDDRTLRLWDLDDGRLLATFEGHTSGVNACAITPDGRRVISASNDRTLRVWDLGSNHLLTIFEGHAGVVTACAVTPDGRRVVSASGDRTLKIWDLEGGRLLATLEGHASGVNACAVTPDGRRVVSASNDRTLKVWDLDSGRLLATLEGHAGEVHACVVVPVGRGAVSTSEDHTIKVWSLDTYTCLLTHRGDTAYTAVGATATVVVAGDVAGAVWFLDWPAAWWREATGVTRPRSDDGPALLGHGSASRASSATPPVSASRPGLRNHVILFLAANPRGTSRLALDEECAAIERELGMTSGRDDFDFRSKWAVSVDDMMRHLNELQPTVVHFSGHGGGSAGIQLHDEQPWPSPTLRHIGAVTAAGIQLHDEQHLPQHVSARALGQMIGTASPSTRLVVLNACFSDAVADALRGVVDCVVGMTGAIGDGAARSFAVGFYRALGYRRSVGNAVAQAVATMAAKQLPDEHLPVCRTRDGVSADQVILPSLDPHGP